MHISTRSPTKVTERVIASGRVLMMRKCKCASSNSFMVWNTALDTCSLLEDRDRPRPAGTGAPNLVRKAGDGEAVAGQRFEIVQFLDVAVADVAAGLVAFPDDRGIVVLLPFLGGEVERRIPAPGIGTGEADTALEQVHGGVVAHAAARVHIVVVAVARAGARVDHDDLERLQHVTDALQLVIDFLRGDDMTVGHGAEVELYAGLEAPFERHLVDSDGALALVHRRMEMIGRVEMRAV